MFNKSSFIAFAMVSLLATAAAADDASFKFTGTVIYGGTLASIGSPVTGTFSYKANGSAAESNQQIQSYIIPAPHVISAVVEGHSLVANNLEVNVVNDFGGNIEDSVTVSGSPVIVDQTAYPDGFFELQVASIAGNTGVLTNTNLPGSYNVQAFDAPGFNTASINKDRTHEGGLLQFTIDSIECLSKCK